VNRWRAQDDRGLKQEAERREGKAGGRPKEPANQCADRGAERMCPVGEAIDRRNAVVLTTQRIGPAPIKKKLSAASSPDGIATVSSMVNAATTPPIGPIATTVPRRSPRMIRAANAAPPIMPTPNAANVTPTPVADSCSVWIAYGT
jgi:hypothetical protein